MNGGVLLVVIGVVAAVISAIAARRNHPSATLHSRTDQEKKRS